MAVPANTGWAQWMMRASTEIRDVSPVLADMLKADPKVLGRVKTGVSAKSVYHEWTEQRPFPATVQLNGAITGAAVTTLTVDSMATAFGADQLKWPVRVGTVLRSRTNSPAGAANELMMVTTVTSATSLEVVRAWGDSTGVAANPSLADDSVLEVLFTVGQEGSSPGQEMMWDQYVTGNYSMILHRDFKISRTQMATSQYGINDLLAYNVVQQTQDIKSEIQKALFYSSWHETAGSRRGSSTTFRTMQGLRWWLTSTASVEGTVVPNHDSTTTTMSFDLINTLAGYIADDNGKATRLLAVMHPHNYAILQDTWADRIRITRDDTTVGRRVETLITDYYDVDLLWDMNVWKSDIFLLDMNNIELNFLSGGNLFMMDYNIGVDGITKRLLTEFTCSVKNAPYAHAIATGLTTT